MRPEGTPSADEVTLRALAERLALLEDEVEVRRVTTRMATFADQRDWDSLLGVFADTVRADWSALSGEPATTVPAAELVGGWRRALSGLDATHHLLGNQDVTIGHDQATATAYVHAAHRLDNAHASPLWIVAGRYTYRLARSADSWLITAATFQPMWGWGNQQIMTSAQPH